MIITSHSNNTADYKSKMTWIKFKLSMLKIIMIIERQAFCTRGSRHWCSASMLSYMTFCRPLTAQIEDCTDFSSFLFKFLNSLGIIFTEGKKIIIIARFYSTIRSNQRATNIRYNRMNLADSMQTADTKNTKCTINIHIQYKNSLSGTDAYYIFIFIF